MKTLKLFLKRMKAEKSYLIVIVLLSIFIVVGYFSYAMFTVNKEQKEAIRIITGTLTGELKVDNVETDKLVVNQGETKEFTITLRNNNDRTARYLLYYMGDLPDGLEAGYVVEEGIQIPPEDNGRNIDKDITETYKIRVRNKTESNQTILLKLGVGLENIDLTVSNSGYLFGEISRISAVSTLLADYTNSENIEFNEDTKNKMFIYHHEETEQQENWTEEELTDYRYIGANPNNYVTFNGEEAGWRIIGVFTVENEQGEKEQRIKLIRDSIGGRAWDTGNTNDWSNSSLMKEINPNTGSTTFNLTNEALKTAGFTKWYLGGWSGGGATANQFYSYERGNNVYSNRPISWIGKVGLIYISDYGYAMSDNNCLASAVNSYTDICINNNWIFKNININLDSNTYYQWTITPWSNNGTSVFNIYPTGIVQGNSSYNSLQVVCPSIYLNSIVQISQGTGTKEDPFVFTL